MLQELKNFFESDEEKKYIEDYFKKIKLKRKIHNKQLRRLKKENFHSFLEKIIKKYKSKEYQDRYWDKGFEPENSLYYFLFDWVAKYGRNCSPKEWKKYSNTFTNSLFYYEEYYFLWLNGQGSYVQIKDKNNNLIN